MMWKGQAIVSGAAAIDMIPCYAGQLAETIGEESDSSWWHQMRQPLKIGHDTP